MPQAPSPGYPVWLAEGQTPPCISLYQPTHRTVPDRRQDPIRYGNLLKQIEESLRRGHAAADVDRLLEPLRALAGDRDFWGNTLDGLAVLRNAQLFQVHRLQRPVPERAVVADSFHVKPMLRILQSADRYQILAIDRQRMRLFEGNRDVLDEIEPAPEVPRTIDAIVTAKVHEPPYMMAASGTGPSGPGYFHGHHAMDDKVDGDMEKFFREVDRAIIEHHSKPSGLPLMLAALPEHQPVFRRISHNSALMEQAIDGNPHAMSTDELRGRAWRLVEPLYLRLLDEHVDRYNLERSRGLGSDDLHEVAQATLDGRVDTLLLEAERQAPGRLDEAQRRILHGDLADPLVDDLLDDICEAALRRGGRVVVVPAQRMPSHSGLAAIYRY